MAFFKKTGEYLTGKKKVKNIKDVGNAYGSFMREMGDPIGITDPFFEPGPSRPNTSGFEQANDKILGDLNSQIPGLYEEARYAGDFTPETVQKVTLQQDSGLNNISVDPRLKDAQIAALASLQERTNGGYSVEDRAAINRAINESAMQERAQRDALIANANARGVGGSGVALAQQLTAQQNAANRANQNTLDVAAEGRRRALEAVMQSGQLASNMRGQEFDQQARVAAAQDAINQFNTRNVNDQTYYNTGARNAAGLRNVDTRQNLNASNAAGRNTFNQNQFDNRARVAEVRYNDNTNKANQKLAEYKAKVDANNKRKSGIFSAVGAGVGAYYGGPQGAAAGQQAGKGVGGMFEEDY